MIRSFIFFLILIIPRIILSQDFSTTNVGDSVTMCLIRTDENTRLRGKLISENSDRVIMLDITFGEITVKKRNIRYFEKMKPGCIFEIEYGNKNNITGKIISANKDKWKVNSKVLGEVEINTSDIKEFYQVNRGEETGESEEGNIDPGRYFAGPAPFALKKNKLLFQNTEVLLNGMSYGLFKDFTVTGGLLFIYIPYANLKYATEITHTIHISVGAMGIGFPIISSGNEIPLVGAGYAQAAFGDYENHISLGVYYPYFGSFFSNGSGFSDQVSFSGGGIKRISKQVSLMAEDYFIPYATSVRHYYPPYTTYTTTYVNAGAAGVKIFLKKGLFGSRSAALNIGMLWVVNSNIGRSNNSFFAIPVVSYANISSSSK